jgi:hypothetical protein
MGEEFITQISKIEGDVLVANHGYLPSLAGKKTYAHAMSVYDVLHDQTEAGELFQQISMDLRKQRFAAIILDDEQLFRNDALYNELISDYSFSEAIFDKSGLCPITGAMSCINYIYLPIEQVSNMIIRFADKRCRI